MAMMTEAAPKKTRQDLLTEMNSQGRKDFFEKVKGSYNCSYLEKGKFKIVGLNTIETSKADFPIMVMFNESTHWFSIARIMQMVEDKVIIKITK